MATRYSYGGDEHVFVEVDEEMSLEAFFKSLSITNAVRESRIKGVTEICPANASLPDQVRSGCDQAGRPARRDQDNRSRRPARRPGARRPGSSRSRCCYNDPWTRETLMRFRERHQAPDMTDIEYTAQDQHLDGVDGFVEAHSGAPWFVSMVGFVAGLPFLYQMVERKRADRDRRNISVRAPTRRS